jgi:tripartite-type tricarboxylate transporter receptor subunit TctC
MARFVFTTIAVSALAASLGYSSAHADAVEDFYHGKTITFVIASNPGGSYDIYSRLLADNMPRYIPGKPTMIVKHAGGSGGGLPMTNAFHNTGQRDGSEIGMTQQTAVLAQILTPDVVKYDARQWGWIGLMTPIRNMLGVGHTAPAQTLDEAKEKEVLVGATGRASPMYIVPIMLNEIYGTKFKPVMGYKNVAEVDLAMERGEVFGRGASWQSVVSQKPQYIAEKKFKALVVDGLTRDPEIPDVPLMIELAKTDQQKQAVMLVSSAAEFGRSVFTPPGVPADRLAALRKAFDATMKDPAFLAEAKKRDAPIEPQNAAYLEKTTAAVINSPPEVVAIARKLMGE